MQQDEKSQSRVIHEMCTFRLLFLIFMNSDNPVTHKNKPKDEEHYDCRRKIKPDKQKQQQEV